MSIVEVGLSKRSMSKTSAGKLVSLTMSDSSICHVDPAAGCQIEPVEVAWALLVVL